MNYLKNLVALRIDEYTEGGAVPDLPGGDIDAELSQAVRYILHNAPRSAVLPLAKKADSPTLTQNEVRHSTIISLPSDYLRFLSVQGSEWDEPATYTIEQNSEQYRNQKYEMSRASEQDPVVSLIPYINGDSKQALELFPKTEELDSQGLLYVPQSEPYDLGSEFDDAIGWRTAAQLLVILRSPSAEGVLKLADQAILTIGTDEVRRP